LRLGIGNHQLGHCNPVGSLPHNLLLSEKPAFVDKNLVSPSLLWNIQVPNGSAHLGNRIPESDSAARAFALIRRHISSFQELGNHDSTLEPIPEMELRCCPRALGAQRRLRLCVWATLESAIATRVALAVPATA